MTEKVCSHHKGKRRKLIRRCCAGLLIFNFILLIMILLIWAILQPKKPRFILQDATIFNLNVSAANVISTTVQVTIVSRNPNSKIGIYYDKLDAFATYRNQQVTLYTIINPVYQGHKDVNVWSPFLYGSNVPVAPFNGIALAQDQSNGGVQMTVRIDGRVKWKVGAFVSGRYHLHVSCPAFIPLGSGRAAGVIIGTAVKYTIARDCDLSV